ncbi:MAG TPA: hypothetical protein VM143_06465 [Acidimicrobiales bacterium]|nr:hypothetical protein [Acidimicrobiales bacterium]
MASAMMAAAGLVTAVLSLAACGSDRDQQSSTPLGSDDPGVAHVHGLGIDPADGALYAATHTGIFVLPAEGEATRLADRYQDTMGFTVVGPRHFLGSGHPDQQDKVLHQEGTPPLLGLIESTDAGETWQKQSLFGEADFHSLVAIHGRVYGYEATGSRFLVSTDMKTWERRSEGITLGGFAVSPSDPELVVATGQTGAVRSNDGGRTFAPLADAPPLALVAWDTARGLWGVAADRAVFAATTPAGPWSDKGTLPGEPEAFLIADSDLYAAVMTSDGRTAIYRSSDDAATWQLRYRDPD